MKDLKNDMLDIFTKKEVMDLLSLKSHTVWRWQKNGWLKPITIGKKIYFKKNDVIQLLDSGYHNDRTI